jgi:uncharacterized protein YggE
MRNILLFALAASSVGFAQHSVTVMASRSATIQPDQAVVTVNLDANTSTGLDDVVAALQGSGVTSAELSSVSTVTAYLGPAPQQMLQWTFIHPIALSQTKDTLASLASLQKKVNSMGNGFSLTFAVQGVQLSSQLLQSQQCSAADLLADARAQAQKLADAAGFFLGPVKALSTGAGDIVLPPVPVAVFAVLTLNRVFLPFQNTPDCSIVVTFGLN